ncbi:hypothetical protein L0668_15410 [Paraglaciecola aquimarina]|uniref:6-bladed beta-propeller n=1 Tax=Paraglaciecola algarum TaxID=3050085 RepID=A0ABS9DBV4_9ALTE|nr:hypothetical protein [Paraglaciecola sp. G1-23]MCF2949507.1 hypothetical protein [Paraglaciecola sp. G1-23]
MLKIKRPITTLALSALCSFSVSQFSFAHEHKVHKLAKPSPVIEGKTIISGGYEYQAELLQLPKEVDIKHAHGLTRDNEDNIYLAYESNDITDKTHAIIKFDKNGKFVRYIGDSKFAWGAPHGLDLVYENGKKYLYLSNNWLTVRKIDMQGNLVWQSEEAPDTAPYQVEKPKYRPTDTATNPNSKQVYIADGYGSSTITERDKITGEYAKKLWDGTQSGKHFKTPHGVTYDARNNQVLVADRENSRIVAFDTQGNFIKVIEGEGISRVCNTDTWQDQLLVPNLNGSVAYLDKHNKLIDVIEINQVLGEKGHKHPHDAIFMSNGDIVIGTWNPGKLSYWKKL